MGNLPPRRRTPRRATTREDAAAVVAKKLGDQWRALGRLYLPYNADLGRAILDGIDELQSVGDDWLEYCRAEQAQMQTQPSERELSASEVAGLVGVSARRVTQLCDDGVLVARKLHGRWLIAESSVVAYRQRREQSA